MRPTTQLLEQKVRRFSRAVALVVAFAVPVAYGLIAYDGLADSLDFKAKVKASALSSLIATSPNVWMFAENRLQGLIAREPVLLDDERVQVVDSERAVITTAGRAPSVPSLQRAYALHDSGHVVGEVVVTGSMRPLLRGIAVAVLLSLTLSVIVYRGSRRLLLAALKIATDAQERAETSLRSIGDAVITTDAEGRIDSINRVAERLLGVMEADVCGRPVAEVVHLQDAKDGAAIDSSLYAALRSNAIVSCRGTSEIRRSDGTRIAVEESAAPIDDRQGALVGAVLVLRDVTQAREYVERRSWEATHDALTGLLNRRGFESHVQAALSEARTNGRAHVLCYMDLDGFKLVNDTAGHPAGDELLVRLAELLKARVRESDVLARLGGDEFGLLLKGCDGKRGESISADILAAVNEFKLAYGQYSFKVGVSIGLTVIGEEHSGVAEAFSEADCACYLAKEQGRNRVLRFHADDARLAARRSETGWVQRIDDAMKSNRFVLYQQRYRALHPQAGAQEHLEVLLRMLGDDGEVIGPGRFLPAAERFNLMPAIDRWVINEVFGRHRALIEQREGAVPLCAINLSGASINSAGMLKFLRDQVVLHKIEPRHFCLELTETVAVSSLQVAIEFIRECKAMGFQFALDDFGTGASSFAYLKSLPVDYLKIDGSFVRNIERDSVDEAMVDAINRVGHLLGKRTVAEYAESEAIVSRLAALGVDFAQGYAVGRPQPLFTEHARGQGSSIDTRPAALV
jgi:diguanylate cyclase (GGDEF)-like protein/PAS domain S-box-containing protein